MLGISVGFLCRRLCDQEQNYFFAKGGIGRDRLLDLGNRDRQAFQLSRSAGLDYDTPLTLVTFRMILILREKGCVFISLKIEGDFLIIKISSYNLFDYTMRIFYKEGFSCHIIYGVGQPSFTLLR